MQPNDPNLDAQNTEENPVLVVSQNNEKQTVMIVQTNAVLAQALGRLQSEMEGQPLKSILTDKIAEALDDYLEYEEDGNDLEDVLRRVQQFKLKHFNGTDLAFGLRIFRDHARDSHSWFRLILKDERRQIKDNSLLDAVRKNFEGIQSIDEEVGLPDRYTAGQYLHVLQTYVQSHDLNAVVAVLRIDRYEKGVAKYGRVPSLELLRHVAACCKSKFRSEDVVCRLSDKMIGLFLFNITHETARVVLNRLRWHIAQHRISFGGKADFSVTISLSFMPLMKDESRDVLVMCEEAMGKLNQDERNIMIDLGV